MAISDVSVSMCKGFTALVSADCSGRELQGYVKVTMSLCHSWAPSCRTLLIYTSDFFIELVLLLPLNDRSSQIPRRSLTINSEVADAAHWDGVWVSSWQGRHHSCVTCPQYIWHVLSNADPSPLYHISAIDIRSKDLHWFHSISLLPLSGLWHDSQVSFLQSTTQCITPFLLYVLYLHLSNGWCMWWCLPLLMLSEVLTFPDVSALLPYVQWERGRLVLICYHSCGYAESSTEKYSLCLVRKWIDNGQIIGRWNVPS